MSCLPPNFNLPPGVTDQMIEEHNRGCEDIDGDEWNFDLCVFCESTRHVGVNRMGEAKQIEAEARGYGAQIDDDDRPEDYPWPSEAEVEFDADNES